MGPSAVGIILNLFFKVGKGDSYDQAWSEATNSVSGKVIAGINHCSELPYHERNQLGGFWDDYGSINYEDGDTHWYCSTGGGSGACNAGDGALEKK